MKCSRCDNEATKVMTLLLAIEPDEQEGNMSYEKIQSVASVYFCDKHAFVLESISVDVFENLIKKTWQAVWKVYDTHMKRINILITDEQHNWLMEKSKNTEVSLSEQIRFAISEYIKKIKKES